jgi:hypothetical protein
MKKSIFLTVFSSLGGVEGGEEEKRRQSLHNE